MCISLVELQRRLVRSANSPISLKKLGDLFFIYFSAFTLSILLFATVFALSLPV
uniref:Uncharacterized protein n=1 Tax=Arundo donax TaxID=35708 RepID=A0A0A9EC92_ARUDO